MAVFLSCGLSFCEPSKGLPWTKAPSQHVANGLTKHDRHPLLPCSTPHPVTAFVLLKAVGPDSCGVSTLLTGFQILQSPHFPPFISALYCQVFLHLLVDGWPKYSCSSSPPLTSSQNTSLLLLFLLFITCLSCFKSFFIHSFGFVEFFFFLSISIQLQASE